MLNKVLLAAPFLAQRRQQRLNHFPLVIAGENHRLFLLETAQCVLFVLHLQMQIATQNIEEGLGRENLLP